MARKSGFSKWLGLALLSVLTAIFSLCFVACGEVPPAQKAEFSGVKDVRLSVKATDYDFTKGVIAVDGDGKTLEITVDDSSVVWGTAGQYTVKYQTANGSKECSVYIYGEPKLAETAVEIPYAVATGGGTAVASLISATDTFGGKATVTVNTELALAENGSVQTGAQELVVTLADGYGNTAQKTISVTVLAPTKTYSIANQSVDFARAYCTVELVEGELLSVYAGGVKCGAGEYAFDNGYFMLLPKLVSSLGVGEHIVTLNFADGTQDITLTVTDEEEPSFVAEFDLTGEEFLEKETVILPLLGKAEYSVQEFEIKTYIQAPNAEKVETNGVEYALTVPGEYIYSAECIKDGKVVKTISQTFTAISLKEHYGQNFVKEKYTSALKLAGVTMSYQAGVGEGTADVFNIALPAGATSNNGLHGFSIDEKYISDARSVGYTILELCFYTRSGFAVYNGQMGGTLLAYSDKASEAKTVTLKIELAKITEPTIYVYMWHNASAQVDVYMTKLQFAGIVNVTGSLVNEDTMAFIAGSGCTVSFENGEIKIYASRTASGSAGAPSFTISVELLKKAKESGFTHLHLKIRTKCGGKGNAGGANGTNLMFIDAHATEERVIEADISLEKLGDNAFWVTFYHNDEYGEELPSAMYITEMEFITKQ